MLGCSKTVKDRAPSHVASTELRPALAMSTARLALAWKILLCVNFTHWLFNMNRGGEKDKAAGENLTFLTGSQGLHKPA